MKNLLTSLLLVLSAGTAFSQSKFPVNEVSINAFRNPSIGLEYRHLRVSVHAGFYTTAFKSGEYTNFFKTGATYWFAPVDSKPIPSSFYAGASYLRGLNKDYKSTDAAGFEAGFRWMVWQGLNLRIGAIALTAKGHGVKVNPTPGISYSIHF